MQTRVALTITLLSVSVSAAAQTWTPPRTPWGDPDLQGNYSNKYEQGTPFERPAEFEGRTIQDIKGDELADLVRERAVEVLLNSPFSGGDPIAGNFGGAPAFYDRFEANKGSRPWFVVDPTDGKVPAMSPEGRKASPARAAARAALRRGRGTADSYVDRSLYDRCITRGLPGSMMPTNYGNSYRIVQGRGSWRSRTRWCTRRASSRSTAVRRSARRFAATWAMHAAIGTATRSSSRRRTSRTNRLSRIESADAAPDRALHATLARQGGVVGHRGRPGHVDAPWTFAMPLTRNDKEAIFEYACHEGNRAMSNLLSAARAQEKAEQDAAAKGIILKREREDTVTGDAN